MRKYPELNPSSDPVANKGSPGQCCSLGVWCPGPKDASAPRLRRDFRCKVRTRGVLTRSICTGWHAGGAPKHPAWERRGEYGAVGERSKGTRVANAVLPKFFSRARRWLYWRLFPAAAPGRRARDAVKDSPCLNRVTCSSTGYLETVFDVFVQKLLYLGPGSNLSACGSIV